MYIGAATAARLVVAGRTVYATARRIDDLTDLAAAGARVRALDVTDTDSVEAVVDEVVAEHGAVGALVHGATATPVRSPPPRAGRAGS